MISYRKHLPIYFALFLAFIVCCRVLWIQHGWITNDSILYFEMARHLSKGNVLAAYAVEGYTWGFYPALIALVHCITSLSLQTSANLLIITFFMLLVWGLMQTVSIAGGNDRVQLYVVLLLLGSTYIIGNILPMASRDIGYWALMIHAVNQLILFYQHGRLQYALCWQIFALIATLFRIEGAIQLLFLPLAGLMLQRHISVDLKKIAVPYIIPIAASLIAPVILMLLNISLYDLGRINEIFTGIQDIEWNITQNLTHRVDVMRDAVIGEAFEEYSWFTFLLVYFSITTIKCFTVAGWSPALLFFSEKHSLKKGMQPVAYQVLVFWLFISWVIGCLITFKVNLLSARYVALFGFVLMVFSSFALNRLLQQKKHLALTKKVMLTVVTTILVAGFIGNVKSKSRDFYYEIDAVNYIESRLPAGKILYSSAKQRFYADVPYDGRSDYDWDYLAKLIADGTIRQYEYVLIKLDDTAEERAKLKTFQNQLNGFGLEKTFYGHKKKKLILVFKRID